jgi:small conductance mechanosensitive channel
VPSAKGRFFWYNKKIRFISPMPTATNPNALPTGNVLRGGGTDFNFQSFIFEIGVRFLYVIEGIGILILGAIVIRLARAYLQRIQVANESQRMAINLIEKLITGFLTVVTIMLALKVIGLDLTLLISSLALGLSFGLKDIIKNYVSGILILFKSPFLIGDIVKIKRFTGRVEKIDFQSTTLRTFDNREVTVYNKDILSQSITNFTKDETRRIEMTVALGRGTDVHRAVKVFEAILGSHPEVLKNPKWSIVFHKFAESGIRLKIRFWCKRMANILKVRSEIAFGVEKAFDESHIFTSYQTTVQFATNHTLTEDRQKRIQGFYSLPLMKPIMEETLEKLEGVMAGAEEGTLVDKDEPEFDDM